MGKIKKTVYSFFNEHDCNKNFFFAAAILSVLFMSVNLLPTHPCLWNSAIQVKVNCSSWKLTKLFTILKAYKNSNLYICYFKASGKKKKKKKGGVLGLGGERGQEWSEKKMGRRAEKNLHPTLKQRINAKMQLYSNTC